MMLYLLYLFVAGASLLVLCCAVRGSYLAGASSENSGQRYRSGMTQSLLVGG